MRENLESISHKCHLFEVAFVWELTEETIHLPLGWLQGGYQGGIRFEQAAHQNKNTTSDQPCMGRRVCREDG